MVFHLGVSKYGPRYWTPNCSWCVVGTLHGSLCHQWGPCDELATCPGCTLPSPRDSWDWLQQNPHDPIKGIKRLQTMDGWVPSIVYLSESEPREISVSPLTVEIKGLAVKKTNWIWGHWLARPRMCIGLWAGLLCSWPWHPHPSW